MTDDSDNRRESPQIEEIKWGFMKVKGCSPGKDFKLFPGGAEIWDWNKTNTHHVPGIQRQDVEDLIKRGAKFIVLSKGMEDKLETPKETEDFLIDNGMTLGVDYFIKTTPQACELYNQFVEENKPVGALIHSTC